MDVLDKQREPILGLKFEDFTVTVSDNTAESLHVQSFGDSGIGVTMVLGIDASGTMAGQPLEQAKLAVIQYISDLRPQDRVAVLAFHDQVEIVSGFTSNYSQVKQQVLGIAAKGSRTELFRCIHNGLDLLANSDRYSKRVLIVLSDGKDEGTEPYLFNEENCINRSRENNVPIYSIGFSRLRRDRDLYMDVLRNLAQDTDGAFYQASSSLPLSHFYRKTRHHFFNQYIVSFDISEVVRDSVCELALRIDKADLSASDRRYVEVPFVARTRHIYLITVGFVFALLSGLVIIFYKRKQSIQKQPSFDIDRSGGIETFEIPVGIPPLQSHSSRASIASAAYSRSGSGKSVTEDNKPGASHHTVIRNYAFFHNGRHCPYLS